MNRRHFLRLSAAATPALFAGCPADGDSRGTDNSAVSTSTAVSTATTTDTTQTLRERASVPDNIGFEFNTVKNVLELGADPRGEEPMTSLLFDNIADSTLLVFPAGRYRLGRLNPTNLSNFGFVSMNGAQPTLVPDVSQAEMGDWFLAFSGKNIILNGFDLDFTKPGHGARTQIIATEGDFWCQNIRILGQIESSADAFAFLVENEGGTGYVNRLIARDGSPSDGGSTIGIFVPPRHAGKININNCELWHFQGKGIYASNPAERTKGARGGTIHVDGGLYKNNNPAHIRLGGGSTIRNVAFKNEDTLEGESVTWKTPLPSRHGVINARSVRVKGDKNGRALIENCEFTHKIGFGSGVITVTPSGGAIVRDCDITLESGGLPAIHLKPDRTSLAPSIFENLSVTGGLRDAPGVHIRERTDVEFTDSEIMLPNTDVFSLTQDSNVLLLNTTIDAGNRVLMFDHSGSNVPHTIRLQNVDSQNTQTYEVLLTDDDRHISGRLHKNQDSSYEFESNILTFRVEDGILVEISGSLRDQTPRLSPSMTRFTDTNLR